MKGGTLAIQPGLSPEELLPEAFFTDVYDIALPLLPVNAFFDPRDKAPHSFQVKTSVSIFHSF